MLSVFNMAHSGADVNIARGGFFYIFDDKVTHSNADINRARRFYFYFLMIK